MRICTPGVVMACCAQGDECECDDDGASTSTSLLLLLMMMLLMLHVVVYQTGGSTKGLEPRVVVINPGRLAKGNSGGTYAQIAVAEGSGSIADRCRVDIVRV